jgi:hypothetical protein
MLNVGIDNKFGMLKAAASAQTRKSPIPVPPIGRESGNREPPIPGLAGNRELESGSRLAANREIRDTRLCEYSMHGTILGGMLNYIPSPLRLMLVTRSTMLRLRP